MKRGEGRPAGGYYLADGTRVPSVTSINSYGGDSGGLVYKAKKNWHKAGAAGKPFTKDDYWPDDERFWGDAKETGSIVHQWIEDDIHGNPPTKFEAADEHQLVQAKQGYAAYLHWRKTTNPQILETEAPLVSEEFGFGGTLDAIALIDGRRVLLDWKTSNSSRIQYIAQLAAYRQLVNEADSVHLGDQVRIIGLDNSYDGTTVRDAYLLRVGKEFGDFHYHYWPETVLDLGWEWFLAVKQAYELDKRLKKVAT